MNLHPGTHSADTIIRSVLQRFPIDDKRAIVDSPAHAVGFSGALVLRIQVGDATYCLRRWPRAELPQRRLTELHRFLQFVNCEGFRLLPVPISSLIGTTLIEQSGHWWQLEPWMPGTANFHDVRTESRLDSVMRVLASFHTIACRYVATNAGLKWFQKDDSRVPPSIDERMRIIDRWSEERVLHATTKVAEEAEGRFQVLALQLLRRFQKTHSAVRAELQQHSESRVPVHPCLRDVWHDHVLFTNEEVTGLVDPSATRTESVAADLSRLLGSLLGSETDECWGRAIDTYDWLRPLSMSEHQLIGVLHRSGVLLSGMTWIDRWLNDEIPETLRSRVVDRMAMICDSPKSLRGI